MKKEATFHCLYCTLFLIICYYSHSEDHDAVAGQNDWISISTMAILSANILFMVILIKRSLIKFYSIFPFVLSIWMLGWFSYHLMYSIKADGMVIKIIIGVFGFAFFSGIPAAFGIKCLTINGKKQT